MPPDLDQSSALGQNIKVYLGPTLGWVTTFIEPTLHTVLNPAQANAGTLFANTGLSAESLSNGVTGTGAIVLQDSPTITGITYLGVVNSQAYPDTGIGAAFSWNFTGGGGEVDIWNTFTGGANRSFLFKQMTGTGTASTVATIWSNGRVEANTFNAGTITGQANQLELQETGLTASNAAAQVVISRTEADTPPGGTAGEEGLIIISGHRTGGSGSRDGILLSYDATTGSSGEFMVALNSSVTAKKPGAAYALDVFGATIGAGAQAALPNVNVVALECNTNALGDVARKVGIQVIDVLTSVGHGTNFDAGIFIGKQVGARGFDYGILFPNVSDENLALLAGTTGTVPYAMDFSGVTFSTAAWKGDFNFSGNFKLQAAQLATNASVATAITSVGPVGSHTTVQEWMVVKGTGGATRWIPLF